MMIVKLSTIASMISGIISKTDCKIVIVAFMNASISVGSNSGITATIPSINDVTASNKGGKTASISPGNCSAIIGASFCTSLPTPCNATSILGKIFSAKVATLSTKFPTRESKSAFSSAMPVSIFDHAAFIAAADPCMVELASVAVVPVMPSSV